MKEQANTWAERDFSNEDYSSQTLDTINFLRAWVFYSNRSLNKAVDLFDRVGEESNHLRFSFLLFPMLT